MFYHVLNVFLFRHVLDVLNVFFKFYLQRFYIYYRK